MFDYLVNKSNLNVKKFLIYYTEASKRNNREYQTFEEITKNYTPATSIIAVAKEGNHATKKKKNNWLR